MEAGKVYEKDEIVGAINQFLAENLHSIDTGPHKGSYTNDGTSFDRITISMVEYYKSEGEVYQHIEITLVDSEASVEISKVFELKSPIVTTIVTHDKYDYYQYTVRNGCVDIPMKKFYIRAEIYKGEPMIYITDR